MTYCSIPIPYLLALSLTVAFTEPPAIVISAQDFVWQLFLWSQVFYLDESQAFDKTSPNFKARQNIYDFLFKVHTCSEVTSISLNPLAIAFHSTNLTRCCLHVQLNYWCFRASYYLKLHILSFGPPIRICILLLSPGATKASFLQPAAYIGCFCPLVILTHLGRQKFQCMHVYNVVLSILFFSFFTSYIRLNAASIMFSWCALEKMF